MFNVALRPCEMFVCIFFKGGETKGEIYRGRGGENKYGDGKK